jgi:hypothetical protein
MPWGVGMVLRVTGLVAVGVLLLANLQALGRRGHAINAIGAAAATTTGGEVHVEGMRAEEQATTAEGPGGAAVRPGWCVPQSLGRGLQDKDTIWCRIIDFARLSVKEANAA